MIGQPFEHDGRPVQTSGFYTAHAKKLGWLVGWGRQKGEGRKERRCATKHGKNIFSCASQHKKRLSIFKLNQTKPNQTKPNQTKPNQAMSKGCKKTQTAAIARNLEARGTTLSGLLMRTIPAIHYEPEPERRARAFGFILQNVPVTAAFPRGWSTIVSHCLWDHHSTDTSRVHCNSPWEPPAFRVRCDSPASDENTEQTDLMGVLWTNTAHTIRAVKKLLLGVLCDSPTATCRFFILSPELRAVTKNMKAMQSFDHRLGFFEDVFPELHRRVVVEHRGFENIPLKLVGPAGGGAADGTQKLQYATAQHRTDTDEPPQPEEDDHTDTGVVGFRINLSPCAVENAYCAIGDARYDLKYNAAMQIWRAYDVPIPSSFPLCTQLLLTIPANMGAPETVDVVILRDCGWTAREESGRHRQFHLRCGSGDVHATNTWSKGSTPRLPKGVVNDGVIMCNDQRVHFCIRFYR